MNGKILGRLFHFAAPLSDSTCESRSRFHGEEKEWKLEIIIWISEIIFSLCATTADNDDAARNRAGRRKFSQRHHECYYVEMWCKISYGFLRAVWAEQFLTEIKKRWKKFPRWKLFFAFSHRNKREKLSSQHTHTSARCVGKLSF